MYFTKLVEGARTTDLGSMLKSSPCIIFFRLGAYRDRVPRRISSALSLLSDSIDSPVVDCDSTVDSWEEIRSIFESLGKVVEGLDSSRPFFLVLECRALIESGAEFVPCLFEYVETPLPPPGAGESDELGEACLEAFGPIRDWVLLQERRGHARARRLDLWNLLVSLAALITGRS